jgi:hypothetical protein
LWKAILLEKEVEGSVRAMEIAAIWVGVHGVKVMEKSVKTGFRFEDIFTFITGHLIPTIGEINEEARASRGLAFVQGFGNKSVVLAVGGVDKEIKTTTYC